MTFVPAPVICCGLEKNVVADRSTQELFCYYCMSVIGEEILLLMAACTTFVFQRVIRCLSLFRSKYRRMVNSVHSVLHQVINLCKLRCALLTDDVIVVCQFGAMYV